MTGRGTAPSGPRRPIAAWLVAFAAACGEEPAVVPGPAQDPGPDPAPATARWSQVEEFRADLAAVRHPSDGKGRVTLVEAPEAVRAGEAARWRLAFEVGEPGIAVGGTITLMPEPFWGWSTPQAERRELPGYTLVSCAAEGVRVVPRTFGGAEAGLMVISVDGAPLEPGDVVELDYGAGPRGAYADRYAGRSARIWVGVDGDGDGVRALLESSPSIDVEARGPERLVLRGPSLARPGATVSYHVSAVDGWANRAPARDDPTWSRSVAISGAPASWSCPAEVTLDADGFARFDVTVGSDVDALSAARLVASFEPVAGRPARAESNPLVLDADATPIVWADLHGHSGLSDGTGAPEDYLRYARDTARLDVIALTDHDHFGARFLDARADLTASIAAATEAVHAPGRFVAIHGYEWTSWIHGHRHVLSFGDTLAVRSSLDERFDTPTELWDALRGSASLTIAHHSSGQPIPVNWTYPPDPVLEPVTEVVSVHGSSEARDAPFVVRGSRDGQFVRDQLDRGFRLGLIGSGDSHDGHPGLAHLSPGYGWRAATERRGELTGTGGVAALRCRELTREGVLDALREREAYATNGPRIVVLVRRAPGIIALRVHGTAPLSRVELVVGPRRGGSTNPSRVEPIPVEPETRDVRVTVPLGGLDEPLYVYLRIVQTDGGAAWVGPYWD